MTNLKFDSGSNKIPVSLQNVQKFYSIKEKSFRAITLKNKVLYTSLYTLRPHSSEEFIKFFSIKTKISNN